MSSTPPPLDYNLRRYAAFSRGRLNLEFQFISVAHYENGFPFLNFAAQQGFGERIFEVMFDGATQRPCTVFFVVAFLDEQSL